MREQQAAYTHIWVEMLELRPLQTVKNAVGMDFCNQHDRKHIVDLYPDIPDRLNPKEIIKSIIPWVFPR